MRAQEIHCTITKAWNLIQDSRRPVIFIKTFLLHYLLYILRCDITLHGDNLEVIGLNYQYHKKCSVCNISPVGSLECLTLVKFVHKHVT